MSVQTYELPLEELAAEFVAGDRDPVEYASVLCDRLDEYDSKLHSFVPESGRRERVLDRAEQRLSQYPEENDRPPLFGVPVGIKDIIHVDGIPTRAGTALPPELFAGPEASCVTRLKDAGAIILGKTVTTEFAGAGPGLTRNPHNLAHTPGGSSSGSAASVAAGYCPLALGTQTGGSVIRPAAFCGVVGLKPSFKRIPRDSVIERSESADHVGMFTQAVAGMERAARVLCDDWDGDVSRPDGQPRLGVPEGRYLENASPEGIDAYENQLERLEREGCSIHRIPVPTFEEFEALDERHNRLTDAELAFVHQEWYDDWKAFYRTPMARRIEQGRRVTTGQLAASRFSRIEFRKEMESLLDDHDLDLWVAPAAPGPAPKTIQRTGDPVMNRPWTHSGLPVITLPAGTTDGLPLGLQFIAPYMADEMLIKWSKVLESLLPT